MNTTRHTLAPLGAALTALILWGCEPAEEPQPSPEASGNAAASGVEYSDPDNPGTAPTPDSQWQCPQDAGRGL